MIDLTPLEVRKKKGDFRRAMRGYDPVLVDDFLDLVADRLEELVRENMALLERVGRQEEQVRDYRDRERALTEALVSAQEMREEVRKQATREAELAKRSAEQQAEELRASAQEEVRQLRSTAQQKASEELASLKQERQREEQVVRELRARREELLGNYRAFLVQELEELGVIARTAGAPVRAPAPRKSAPEPVRVEEEPPEPGPSESPELPELPGEAGPDVVAGDAVAEESALALGADPAEALEVEDEPFAPEPFVDDEAEVVEEAYVEEAAIPVEGVTAGTSDETDVSGSGVEERLYDAIAGDENDDGVPGPIGLGPAEPWNAPPEWSIADLQLVGEDTDGEALDLDVDDEDDEEMQNLLRNAAAAGYRLENDEPGDELLLDEAVTDDDDEPEPPKDDGWLPTLLEDDK
jgi:cell division initiation protein